MEDCFEEVIFVVVKQLYCDIIHIPQLLLLQSVQFKGCLFFFKYTCKVVQSSAPLNFGTFLHSQKKSYN